MPVRDKIEMSEEDALLYDEYKEKSEYYDRLQHVMKIKLNSLYGALSNKFFRFYNLENGESTTATGRKILLHQCGTINEYIAGSYDSTGEVVLAGDTDSTYFLTKTDNKPDAVRVADAACKAVNDSFQTFMQEQFCCTPGFDNLIKSVREIVASRAILIKKKKYIFKVVDAEGHPTDKIKSTGVDIKKTTIPKPISKKLEAFVKRLLDGEDWDSEIAPDIVAYKDELLASDDFTIFGSPMGVKGMEEYTSKYEIFGMKANLPGHTAGSIHWNECLTKYGDRESPRIMSGMKIRVYYLTQTFGKFKNIAVPGDIETYPEWFLKNFVPLIDRKLQIEKLVDGPIENIVKAIGRTAPTKQQLLQNSLLVF